MLRHGPWSGLCGRRLYGEAGTTGSRSQGNFWSSGFGRTLDCRWLLARLATRLGSYRALVGNGWSAAVSRGKAPEQTEFPSLSLWAIPQAPSQ